MSDLVPEGWRLGTLAKSGLNILDGDRGKEYPKEDDFFQNEYCLFLSAKNVTKSGFQFDHRSFITIEKDQKLRKGKLCRNDIVITTRGTVGNIAYFDGSVPFENIRINSGMAIIRNEGRAVDSSFLNQLLRSQIISKQLDLLTSGSAQPQLTIGIIKALTLSVPRFQEQQKIAAILTSVDEVIEKTQAQIDKLKDLKTGMMQQLLTSGVGVDGKPHTEFKDSSVGRIPSSWEVSSLVSITIVKGLQTGPFGGQLHAEEYTEKGIPVIMPKNMKANKVCVKSIARIPEAKAVVLGKHRVKSGDILFSRRGDIGRFVLINKDSEGWLCGTGALRARVDNTIVIPKYLAAYLTLDFVVEWLNNNAVGQTMLNLNTSILGELPVVLPSLFEQKLIAKSVGSIDVIISAKKSKLSTLVNTKKALMQDLLTGKVRVTVPESSTGH